jgi:hypothetical protein
MMELFKKTLTVCAAVGSFGGIAIVSVGTVNSIIDSRVASVVSNTDTTASSADGQISGKDILTGALKKLLK